jgi:hypothetical protein
MLRRLVTWLLVAFVLYLLLTNPDGAASVMGQAIGGLRHAGDELASFIDQL